MSQDIRPEATAKCGAIREVDRLAFDREDVARLVEALPDGEHIVVSE